MERQCDFPIQSSLRSFPLLLIRIPKTGGTSLAYLVYRGHHVQHRTALFYRRADPAWYDRQTSFAIVRHPIRRAVSACNFLLDESRTTPLSDQTTKMLRGIKNTEQLVRNVLLPAADARRLHELDPVLRRQLPYVSDGDEIIVKNIFRLEDRQILHDFLSSHRFFMEIPHLNASKGATAVSPETVEIISHVYREDMEAFGYAGHA